MMKNKLLLSALAVAGTAVFAGSTFAYIGNGGFGPRNVDSASQEQVREAIANGDYSTFQTLMSGDNRASNISEEKFNEMVERYKERKEKQAERKEFHEKNQAAMESGDYNAWKSLQEEDSKMLEIIDTEAKFKKLVELHKLREQAKTLSEELGLSERGMKGGQNKKMNRQKRGGGQGQRGNGRGILNFGE